MPDYRLGRLKGRWCVVWEEGRRRHRWRLIAANAVEARAALRDFARERDALTRPARRITIGDLWDHYIAEKIAQGKAVTRMQDAWKQLAGHFGSLCPSDISPGTVRDYTERRRASVGDGTIHTEIGYLRACLRHGAKHGLFQGNAPHVELPPKPRPRTRFLTPEEARRLIDAAQMPHVRLFVVLALRTAARPSSILDLTWDRVDFRSGRIAFDNPARDKTAKGRATVPFDRSLADILAETKRGAQTDYVIEWAGQPIASIKKGFREAARRAGIKGVTPYVLRHTAAVWMAEDGVSISEISQYLGHTSSAVTERVYARYSPDYLQRAAESIRKRLK